MGLPPRVKGLRPYGNDMSSDTIALLYEEYEALKLADYEGYSQVEAAKRMGVSRPTFTRIYDRALKKVAEGIVEGKEIILEAGSIIFEEDWYKCNTCDFTFKLLSENKEDRCPICSSEDIKNLNHSVLNSNENKNTNLCVCVRCGNEEKHILGIPCNDMICPKCGNKMKKKIKN